MSAAKTPIDLRTVVKERLDQIQFVKSLHLEEVADTECDALDEGTSSSFTQGVRLNESVAIFLDHWGWGRPHNRYSFAVFARASGHWQQVCARIENVNEAVACAIHALAERALLSVKTDACASSPERRSP